MWYAEELKTRLSFGRRRRNDILGEWNVENQMSFVSAIRNKIEEE
jgi:hypothetical protein